MKFVTIKPSEGARVPMPGGYGLPHGATLPKDGFRVPLDAFVQRLLADKDAVQDKDAVEIDTPSAPATEESAL